MVVIFVVVPVIYECRHEITLSTIEIKCFNYSDSLFFSLLFLSLSVSVHLFTYFSLSSLQTSNHYNTSCKDLCFIFYHAMT